MVWAVTVSRDKSSALVLLWLFNIPVSHWPLVICESLILGLPLGELSQPFYKQRLTEPFVCVTVISLSLFSIWLVKAALVHIILLTMAQMTVCKRKEPLKVTKLLNHAQAQLYSKRVIWLAYIHHSRMLSLSVPSKMVTLLPKCSSLIWQHCWVSTVYTWLLHWKVREQALTVGRK